MAADDKDEELISTNQLHAATMESNAVYRGLSDFAGRTQNRIKLRQWYLSVSGVVIRQVH